MFMSSDLSPILSQLTFTDNETSSLESAAYLQVLLMQASQFGPMLTMQNVVALGITPIIYA